MTRLTPKLTLFDLCGPGHVFNSRLPDNAAEWSLGNPGTADAVTGNQLTIVGPMPVLCSATVASPDGLAVLREVGFKLEAEIVTFTDSGDRLERMKALARKGLVFIDQHAQPDPDLHPGRSWVDFPGLSFLNHKGNLSRLVPPPFLPTRSLCKPSGLAGSIKDPVRFPVVVKAGTEKSTGGGKSVLLCRNESELTQAQAFFQQCESVIVEDFFVMRKNLCLNYAVFPDGKIEYLGAADQIVNAELNYMGNWLGPEADPSPDLVQAGREVMTAAWNLGYRGFAGLDAAILEEESFIIYDLNFRFNGSTTPLLLYDALLKQFGLTVAQHRRWEYQGEFKPMIAALFRAIEKHDFVPFCIYDPGTTHSLRLKPRVSALLLGKSREEVHEKEKELNQIGFL